MDTMTVIDLGSIVALVLALVSQKFRQLIMYAVSKVLFIFIRKTYLHQSLGNAFIAYMTKSGAKVKKFSGELFGEDPAFIRSENEVKHILFRDYSNGAQLFYGNKSWPILISGSPLTHHKDMVHNYSYIVYSFRWAKNLFNELDYATEGKNEKRDDPDANRFVVKRVSGGRFIKEVDGEKAANDAKRERATVVNEVQLADPFSAFIPYKWEKSNIGQVLYHNTLEMMSLNPELEDLLEEIKFWFNSQDWYEERGIPWRRGCLFYGRPGTGKTLFSRALAEHLNMPLIVFDLASMNNSEFIEAWSQILPKRIVLFEDFDAVFDKRKCIANDELTFDCILNAIDGVDKKQGILTIVTTNYPERLDPALGGLSKEETINGKKVEKLPSRPGRIDRSVEFLPLNRQGRMKLAMRIVKNEKLAEEIVDNSADLSAAQLQEKAFRKATELLFEYRKNKKAAKEANGIQTN